MRYEEYLRGILTQITRKAAAQCQNEIAENVSAPGTREYPAWEHYRFGPANKASTGWDQRRRRLCKVYLLASTTSTSGSLSPKGPGPAIFTAATRILPWLRSRKK